MTDAEMKELLNDSSKKILGEIAWQPEAEHSPAVQFSADVESEVGYPLIVRGWFNPASDKLSYSIIHRGVGRIYALDLGIEHKESTGNKHKHHWTEQRKAKNTYVPEDITANSRDVIEAWNQFCSEAHIDHIGQMLSPPDYQWDWGF